MKTNLLKPKHMAERLDVAPARLSLMAKDIESSALHAFPKTVLGSFLFAPADYDMLKEYHQLTRFFKKKSVALNMLKSQMDGKRREQKGRPEWTAHLQNAVFR